MTKLLFSENDGIRNKDENYEISYKPEGKLQKTLNERNYRNFVTEMRSRSPMEFYIKKKC